MSEINDVHLEKVNKNPWHIEEFYFGNGEWSIYRSNGERVQSRLELALSLTPSEDPGQYIADASDVERFLSEMEDCYFTVADSYAVRYGDRQPQQPKLWLMGWKDVSEDEIHIYETEKIQAWQNPKE